MGDIPDWTLSIGAEEPRSAKGRQPPSARGAGDLQREDAQAAGSDRFPA